MPAMNKNTEKQNQLDRELSILAIEAREEVLRGLFLTYREASPAETIRVLAQYVETEIQMATADIAHRVDAVTLLQTDSRWRRLSMCFEAMIEDVSDVAAHFEALSLAQGARANKYAELLAPFIGPGGFALSAADKSEVRSQEMRCASLQINAGQFIDLARQVGDRVRRLQVYRNRQLDLLEDARVNDAATALPKFPSIRQAKDKR